MSTPPRVVPTLTEVLDESRFRPVDSLPTMVDRDGTELSATLMPPQLGGDASQGASATVRLPSGAAARPLPGSGPIVAETIPGAELVLHGMRSEAAMAPSAVLATDFQPFSQPEPAPLPASLDDFDLDLSLDFRQDPPRSDSPQASVAARQPEPAWTVAAQPSDAPSSAAPGPTLLDALEDRLRQGLGQELRQVLDDLLKRQLQARLEESVQRLARQLQQELHEALVPQLEGLVDQALSDALRRERER